MHVDLDVIDFTEEARLCPGTEKVPINALSAGESPRVAGEDPDHIKILADLEVNLPPIVVHRATMRVIDGMHRLRAAILRRAEFVEVYFFDGSEADALVLAIKLNSMHGLPLSLADREAAAQRIIRFHPEWSDRRIAKVAGLAPTTVGSIRRRSSVQNERSKPRVGADGRVRPKDSATGRQLAGDLMRENPNISLREAARAAGISLATASDVRVRLQRGDSVIPAQQRKQVSHSGAARRRNPSTFTARRVHPQPAISAELLSILKKDPSLRYTDAGRTLLRAFGFLVLHPQDWNRIVVGVPPHHLETVAQLAKECAAMWLDLGDRLEQRHTDLKSPLGPSSEEYDRVSPRLGLRRSATAVVVDHLQRRSDSAQFVIQVFPLPIDMDLGGAECWDWSLASEPGNGGRTYSPRLASFG